MSSTTQGQVYTAYVDVSSEFIPYIPDGLVNAVGSNVAYAQATGADVTLVNVTLPGGALGTRGALRVEADRSHPNNGNNKIFKVKVGEVSINSTTNTTIVADSRPTTLRNAGSQALNFSSGFVGLSPAGSTDPYLRLTSDTSAVSSVSITAQLAVATDYIVIANESFLVYPS
jgi:hypothetical protein